MSAVYEATDNRSHDTVAVKQMFVGAERALEQEAQFLTALRHPGRPDIIDYFRDGDANLFLVMQYIEGEGLAHVLNRRAPCSEVDVVSWGVAVLDILISLHDHHPPIVHRDIKPSNIKLTPRGDVVLLDFGLAQGTPGSPTRLDPTRNIHVGTPSYAPIEQVEGRGAYPASDLYALGATLLHLVTGVSPVSAAARASAIGAGDPDPLLAAAKFNTTVTPALRGVLTRALEMDAGRRFASAHEMRTALASHRGDRRVLNPPSEVSGARRVDVALPSQAEVGRQVDLIVQVRFADSPSLGLEDRPAKRRPEQEAELLGRHYPEDPRTGKRMPASLQIKVVAPDFVVEGERERLIEVAPDEYSKRIAFLLTPARVGFCPVHVEAYADGEYLGTAPVETESVAVAVANPALQTARLVLGLSARRRPEISTVSSSDTVKSGLGATRSPLDAAPSTIRPTTGAGTSVPSLPSPPEHAAGAATVVAAPAPSAARRRSRSPRLSDVLAPLVLLITAVLLYQRFEPAWWGYWTAEPPPRESLSTPAGGAAPPTGSNGPAPAVSAPAPTARASSQAPAQPPQTGKAPSRAPRMLPGVTAAPTSPLGWVTSLHSRIRVQLVTVERALVTVRASLVFSNPESVSAVLTVRNNQTRLLSEDGVAYRVAADAAATAPNGTFRKVLAPRSSVQHWIDFTVPDSREGEFQLMVGTSKSDDQAGQFPPLKFRMAAQ